MDKKQRKNYLINRCYSAHYEALPKPFKTVNALRYPGLFLCILADTDLYSIQNLTPECTDVLVTTVKAGGEGKYSADFENLDYTLNVFYELNYSLEKLRFVGGEVFTYKNLAKLIKTALRVPKVKKIEVVCNGSYPPRGENLEVLRNPGLKVMLNRSGTLADKIERTLRESDVEYELFDEEPGCPFCNGTQTVFVEGKIFRCPLTAREYAEKGEADASLYVDTVARKLQIKDLRLAMFDITNTPPAENCDGCDFNRENEAALR